MSGAAPGSLPFDRARAGGHDRRVSAAARYDETITLPRAVRFPIELIPPAGFDPARLETWPRIDGRLEVIDDRLLYMPPCADEQQETVTDVVIALGGWVRAHRELVLGTNDAGMRLGGATRAADAAIWRRADVGATTGALRRHPPVLAVEVAGVDESESALRDKAAWYLGVGVAAVWIVLPRTREVVSVTAQGETRARGDEVIASVDALEGLAVPASALFVQLDGG